MKKREKLTIRNNKFISESKRPLLKQLHRFLDSILPSLIQFNDSLSFSALSFYYVNLCNQVWFYNSHDQIKGQVMKDKNILEKCVLVF